MRAFVCVALLFSFLASLSQSRWHPYAGVHFSMDAGGYYFGPSFQLGTDYKLKERITFSGYVHYFADRLQNRFASGDYENGRYRSLIGALLLEQTFGRKERRGWLLGAGIAAQRKTEDYSTATYEENLRHRFFTAALRTGYRFPLRRTAVALELNAVGPFSYTKYHPPFEYRTTETLTQLSVGVRLIL